MTIQTIFVNLSPGGSVSEDSGEITVVNCTKLIVKGCYFEGTATDTLNYVTSNLTTTQKPFALFSGRLGLQIATETIWEFKRPQNFQGQYSFSFFKFDGTALAVTGNVILHLEFHCL